MATGDSGRRRRYEHRGHARYLTFSCFRRLPLFDDDDLKMLLVRSIGAARSRHAFQMWAWVIMPEHVHLLLLPGATTVRSIIQSIKQPVAVRALGRLHAGNAPVLPQLHDRAGRRKFWLPGSGHDRNVYSPRELRKKIVYTSANPVRRGLVERAVDWPWSSAAWYAGAGDVLLEMDPLPSL